MDKRIETIIDLLLDDCCRKPDDTDYNYVGLPTKDLLTITQNFLEFKYPKQTRTNIKDADSKAPQPDWMKSDPVEDKDIPGIQKTNPKYYKEHGIN